MHVGTPTYSALRSHTRPGSVAFPITSSNPSIVLPFDLVKPKRGLIPRKETISIFAPLPVQKIERNLKLKR